MQKAAAQQKKAPCLPRSNKFRASRYGGFAPAAMVEPPPAPDLDLSSPRSLSLVNVNTKEELSVTYWSNGTYHRSALDQLNKFLRDSRDAGVTEMDPLLFDVLWHTARIAGYSGQIEVLLGLSLAGEQCVAGQREPRRGARQPAYERQCHGHPLPGRPGVPHPPGGPFAEHGRRRFLPALRLRPHRHRSGSLLVSSG